MRPETEEDCARLIRAAERGFAIRGGGTRGWPAAAGGAPGASGAGGSAADAGPAKGRTLDTRGMAGIVLYEPAALTMVVRAGTALADVQAALDAEGQMLGFEPDPRPGSTIGGVAAANAAGPRRVQLGAARDALIGLRYVDGRGEIVKNGGRVMKNVTGYDLVKLMAGSRGSLGVLTEVSLRTAPRPPARLTLVMPGLDAAASVAALTMALTGPFDVSGAAWLPGTGAMIRLEGLAGSVEIRARDLTARLSRKGTVEAREQAPWERLHPDASPGAAPAGSSPADASPPGSSPGAQAAIAPDGAGVQQGAAAWDGAAPPGDLWRVICRPSAAGAILAANPAPVALDWGGGLIWLRLQPGAVPQLGGAGGHARRVRGAAPGLIPAADPVVARLQQGLRARFDPRGLFQGSE